MQPFLNSYEFSTISCSHENHMLTSQMVQVIALTKNRHHWNILSLLHYRCIAGCCFGSRLMMLRDPPIMSLNRSENILRFLHFADNLQVTARDKMAKVRLLFDTTWSVGLYGVTVDGSLIRYLGRRRHSAEQFVLERKVTELSTCVCNTVRSTPRQKCIPRCKVWTGRACCSLADKQIAKAELLPVYWQLFQLTALTSSAETRRRCCCALNSCKSCWKMLTEKYIIDETWQIWNIRLPNWRDKRNDSCQLADNTTSSPPHSFLPSSYVCRET